MITKGKEDEKSKRNTQEHHEREVMRWEETINKRKKGETFNPRKVIEWAHKTSTPPCILQFSQKKEPHQTYLLHQESKVSMTRLSFWGFLFALFKLCFPCDTVQICIQSQTKDLDSWQYTLNLPSTCEHAWFCS